MPLRFTGILAYSNAKLDGHMRSEVGTVAPQVALRYVSARIRATDAKAARDKDGQRAAGAAIRELKKARPCLVVSDSIMVLQK
jgi:hypothetical protein